MPNEGWGFPLLAAKGHYFRDGRALCRKWLYFGECYAEIHSDGACKECQRRRAKEVSKAAISG